MSYQKEKDPVGLPPELTALSEELDRSFFAERLAMNAGLVQRIKDHLPRKSSVMARAFRLLGAAFLIASGAALLLMYQLLHLLHSGGRIDSAMLPSISWLMFYMALGFCGGIIAWTANSIGVYFYRKWVSTPSETVQENTRLTPMGIAVWMRGAALIMVLVSIGGLWNETSALF